MTKDKILSSQVSVRPHLIAEENDGGKVLATNSTLKSPEFVNLLRTRLIETQDELSRIKSPDSSIVAALLDALQSEIDPLLGRRATRFILSEQEYSWLTKNTDNKWSEYLIYRYKFRTTAIKKISTEFPPYVLIEPTSICNLRCVMCFQIDKSFTTREYMGRMPMEIFKKAVDEASENDCKAITLASRGEPTLHPELPQMLKYITESGIIDLKLNTNATRLNDSLSRNILDAKVSELVFSVDAGTRDTYERIRVRGKFDEVVANIERFNEIRRKEFPNSVTTTRISGVKVDDDQDIQQMTKFWSSRVDEVSIKPATPRWDSYNNPKTDAVHACGNLWDRIYVWYDGTLNPCDFDYKSLLSVGNIRDTTIKEAWNGPRYFKLRESHLSGRRECHIPCDRCPL